MFKNLIRKCKQSRGFTLMEVMVVVAILAVIAGIAIPAVISMNKNMKFTERNDYAKSIFMAAQSNLTQMRSTGQLEQLTKLTEEAAQDANPYGAPSGYSYTFPTNNTNALEDTYNLVLPVNSVDSTIRDQQVIIEYNPKAGIVYSVFYFEGDDGALLTMYKEGIDRDTTEEGEKNRKDLLVGYYSVGSVDALDAQELNVVQTESTLSFTNTNEGLITVTVPIVDDKGSNIFPDAGNNLYEHYIAGLEVTLTMTGENGGTFVNTLKGADSPALFVPDIVNNAVSVNFTVDSLTSSFAELVKDSEQKILPGDNITVTAEITFIPDADDPIVMIESSTLAGINPMYHSLTQNPSTETDAKPYILAISNARHLQNLNYLDGAFAQDIDSIVFVAQTEEDTVTNSGTGETGGSESEGTTSGGTSGDSSGNSDPSKDSGTVAQVLTLSNTDTNTGNTGSTPENGQPQTPVNTEIAIDLKDVTFTPIDLSGLSYIPKIIGNGVKISNLNINVSTGHAGLFSTLENASIEGITLINPFITNTGTVATSDPKLAPGTGALIGHAIDVDFIDCHIAAPLSNTSVQDEETEDNSENTGNPTAVSIGISGRDSVGGLIGLATNGTTFTNCSSAFYLTNSGKHVGGMVGYAEGTTESPVTFTDCETQAHVTGTNPEVPTVHLGGLVGYAYGTTFTDCTTEATLQGDDETISNLGGLVGTAEASVFSNCDTISTEGLFVKISSGVETHYANGDADHNALGGLVGFAKGSSAAPTTFTNCDIVRSTQIISSSDSYSDMGGAVGRAEGVTFTSCSSHASVNGTQVVKNNADIPNNNLGGFVGLSKSSDYTNIDVNLNYLPAYAMDAGAFAGYISGGEVTDLDLDLTVGEHDAAKHTVQYFGMVAGRIKKPDGSGAKVKIDTAVIETNGNINNANHIAGVAYITQDTNISNVSVTLKGGRVYGNRTAGFVGENGFGSTIQNSSVIGNITYTSDYKFGTLPPINDVAGFTYENSGIIESCIANVILPGGSAFVADNTDGTIKNCYGWAEESSSDASDIVLEITQNCSNSYFVNGTTNAMVLYESNETKSDNITDTEALTDVWAVELLNGSNHGTDNAAWKKGSNDSGKYPYPTLTALNHVGSWEEPEIGNYPFGLIYEETYANDEKGYLLTNLYGNAPGHSDMDGLSNSKTIVSTAFYLYHRTDSSLDSKSSSVLSYDEFEDWLELNRLYSIYKLNAGNYTVDEKTFSTYYPLSSDGSHYRIRTAAQFEYIDENLGSTFVIERSIAPTTGIGTFSGSLSASSGVTIDASSVVDSSRKVDNLIGALSESGILSGLNVSGLAAPMVGTMSGGSITNCVLTEVDIESGSNVGAIVGTMGGGSISSVTASGSVSGSGNVGGALGEVTGGTVTNVEVNVTVNSGSRAGMFAGYISSGTFEKCVSKARNDSNRPFAYFATRKIEGTPTHFGDTLYTSENGLSADDYQQLNAYSNGNTLTTIVAEVDDNCTFIYGGETTTTVKATKHYYKVASQPSITAGSQQTFGFFDSVTPRFDDFALYNEEGKISILNTPVQTNYFVGIGTGYNRFVVSVSEEPEESEYSSSEGTAYYVFTYSDVKNSFTKTQKIEVSKFSKNSSITLEGVNLYQITGTLPTSGSGYYQIKGDGQYLTYGSNGLGADGTSLSTVWFWDQDNAWGNVQADKEEGKIAAKFSKTEGDSFSGPVTISVITPETGSDKFVTNNIYVSQFSLQSVSLRYSYEFIGTVVEVYSPATSTN